jgi:hypothetical protein
MPRAILKGGVIYPIEPLPADWADGREVWIEDAEADTPEAVDQRFAELEESAKQIDPADDERLEEAIADVRRHAKETVRREMGLP